MIKQFFRRLLPLMLVVVTTFLVSCSGPTAKIPTTYDSDRLAAIEMNLTPIKAVRERMNELADLIENEKWIDAGNFIHGPLGFLRQDMRYATEKLLPPDQPKATALTKEFFGHIVQIDAALKNRNYLMASQQYGEAVKDLDSFINLVPQS
jgi:photosystem II protein PsbQ